MSFPKFAIFDMDGLLFDTENIFMRHLHEVQTSYGYPATVEDYIKTVGTNGSNLKRICTEIYGEDYPHEEISHIAAENTRDYIDKNGLDLKPGISSLLNLFRENAIPCCVASSSKQETVKHHLEVAGIYDYFKFIIGGDTINNCKPDPEIFLKAYEQMKNHAIEDISVKDGIIFEDSENGILAAHAAGIPVICIPDLKYPDEKIAKLPVHIFNSAVKVTEFYLNSSENV